MQYSHFTDHDSCAKSVSCHDLVYLTPADDPMRGWPLGNGEIGALFWTDATRLFCVINRSDLWDDAKGDFFSNWELSEEEFSSCQRHGGRLIIDFKVPVFDPIYLKNCQCRLRLSDGMLLLDVESAFGHIQGEFMVPEQNNCIRGEIRIISGELSRTEITLERFGSRTFSHWYRQILNTPEIGLDSTECAISEAGTMTISHQVSDGYFGLGARVFASKGTAAATRLNRFAAETVIVPGEGFSFVAAITKPEYREATSAQNSVDTIITGENTLAFASRKITQQEFWQHFWQHSYVKTSDEFLNQLWYLQLYYACAGQRGRYPGRFIGSLWFWQRDFQAWNFYFHWNQQMTYWPLPASGHPELCLSYLNWRFEGLENAKRAAKEFFNYRGAWVSDVSDRRGFASRHEARNHTPVAQIALDFYRYYQYSGDMMFLREKALPYMKEAALFITDCLEKDVDGVYHARCGTAYEGWIDLKDVITELVQVRALFPAVIEAMKLTGDHDERLPDLSEILANLTDFTLASDLANFSDADGNCDVAMFRGHPWNGDKRLACGFLAKDGEVTFTSLNRCQATKTIQKNGAITALLTEEQLPVADGPFNNVQGFDGLFPWSELSLVYPSGLIGVGDKKSELYKAAVNTALISAVPDGCLAWCPEPIFLARLGLAEECRTFLDTWLGSFQNHENGWFTDSLMTREAIFPRAINRVYDIENGFDVDIWATDKLRRFNAFMFRHMGTEGMGVLGTTVNEMLMQSHNKVIRIAPALPEDMSADFTLLAEGGHRVSARVRAGRVEWFSLTLGFSAQATVVNPWRKALSGTIEDSAKNLTFKGLPGTVFTLTDAENPIAVDTAVIEISEAKPKIHRNKLAKLGLEKLY